VQCLRVPFDQTSMELAEVLVLHVSLSEHQQSNHWLVLNLVK
jgi:hypothetical protein